MRIPSKKIPDYAQFVRAEIFKIRQFFRKLSQNFNRQRIHNSTEIRRRKVWLREATAQTRTVWASARK